MSPFAPGRFSTMTGFFSSADKRSANRRVQTSGVAPGGVLEIKRIGLFGYSCDRADIAANRTVMKLHKNKKTWSVPDFAVIGGCRRAARRCPRGSFAAALS